MKNILFSKLETFTGIFTFVPSFKKGDKGKYQLVVSEKGWKNLKQKIKTITRKTTPFTFDERIYKLKEVQLASILPNSKYSGETQRCGRLGA